MYSIKIKNRGIFLLKIIIKFFITLIFLPIIALIKFFNLRVGLLKSSRIGHFTLDFETYLIEKKKNNKFKDIIFLEKKISNDYLYQKYLENYKLFKSSFFSIFILFIFNNNYFLKKNIINFRNSTNYFNILVKNKIIINDQKLFEKNIITNQLNLPDNANWVCIHNRDENYLNKISDKLNYHSFRDFSIYDFFPAADLLNKNNFFVIRMGNATKTSLKDENKFIIDYANSPFQNDFNDFYLIKNSSLYIGGDSGPWAMSLFLKKKIAIINYAMLGYVNKFFYWNDLPMLFKLIRDKKTKKFLTFSEIKKNNFHIIANDYTFEKEGLELINNTPDDILDLVSELIKIKNFKDMNYFYNTDTQEYEFIKKFNEFFPNLEGKKSYINFPKNFINKNFFLLK